MADQIKISRQNIFVIAFFALLLGLLSLLFSLLEPFLRSFVWATIFVMVFYPVYSFLFRSTGKRPTLAAFLSTLFVMGLLALPGFFIAVNLGREIPRAYAFLSTAQWDEKSQMVLTQIQSIHLGDWLKDWGIDPTQYDAVIQKQVSGALENLSKTLLTRFSEVFANIARFALEVVLVCVALFFFFRDGARLAHRAVEMLPLEKDHREKVARTFSDTVTAVVRAIFLTAVAQGVMSGIGFAVAGVPVPILLGLVAFVNSFIPFLGAASVWIPVSLWLFYNGQVAAGVGMLLWGGVISVVDNVLKPWIIGNRAQLPLFWLFFTTLGGLKVYGILGIFLGPIILSMGLAFLTIYRDVYLSVRKAPARAKR
ncbi:MAG TPA: AI-2E family transporter [bacterium]|nr:AI-2E family transporter [bacterium]